MIFYVIRDSNIIEYQAEKTKNGAIIRVVSTKNINTEDFQKSLVHSLSQADVKNPDIRIKFLDIIPRYPETGMLKKFIPYNK